MNEIMITNPRGSIETATAICAFINRRKTELAEVADTIAERITAENFADPQNADAIAELAEAVEDLRDSGKALVKEVCVATEAQRVLTQIDARLWSYSTKADPTCAYAVLSEKLKAIKAKVAAFKAAALPPAPKHTYVLKLTATDAAMNKIVKAAVKEGADGVLVASAQSDKAVKQIVKWFEENV